MQVAKLHTPSMLEGFVVLSLVLRAHAQCQYEVAVIQGETDCGAFPASPTLGRAVNEQAQVAGGYTTCAVGSAEAFLWDGQLVTLQRPPGVGDAGAWDINDAGLIVGQMVVAGLGDRAFLHDGSQFIDLGSLPGGNLSRARGINSRDQIVGVWGNNVTGDPALAAFLWQDGMMTDLNQGLGGLNSEALDINDASQVIGWMGTSSVIDAHAFIWCDGAVIDLGVIPGGFTAVASAINAAGQVVGSGRQRLDDPPFFTGQAFARDSRAVMEILPVLSGYQNASAADINDQGQIVGVAYGLGGNPNIQAAAYGNTTRCQISTISFLPMRECTSPSQSQSTTKGRLPAKRRRTTVTSLQCC